MKQRFLIAIAAIFGIITNSAAQGVEIEQYSWNIPLFQTVPEYWTHMADNRGAVEYGTTNQEWVEDGYYKALTVGSQKSGDTELSDYLISLPLKGKVNFFVKKSGDNNADVKLYVAEPSSNGNFNVDTSTEIPTDFAAVSDNEYHKITVNLPRYQNIAFRFENVYVAKFQSEYAQKPAVRSLTLNSVSFSEGYKNPFTANENNEVSIKAVLNVTNTGDVTLSENDPNYYGMIAIMESGTSYGEYVPAQQQVKGQLPTLEPGQTGTSEIDFTFVVPDLQPNGSGIISLRIDGLAYLDGQSVNKQVGGTNVQVKPYKGILSVTYNNSTYNPGTESSPRYIDFGMFHGRKELNVTLTNNGIAPINISDISLPEGVDLSVIIPGYTIEPQQSVVETVSLKGNGTIKGGIKFEFDGLGTNVIYVTGVAVPEDVAYYNFEDGSIPSTWYVTDNESGKWEIFSSTSSPMDATNKYCLRHSNSTYPSSVTTGRIHFDEDEMLNLFVALRSTSSGQLKIRISKDRNSWMDIAEFSRTNADFKFPSTSSKFEPYSIRMPEGDWYIDFYGAYVYIDNVFGGIESPLEVDVMPVSVSSKSQAMINYPLSVSATFRNFGKDLNNYEVEMIADGETVATVDGDEFISGDNKVFTLSYIPHEEGSTEINIALVLPTGEKIPSETIDVDVVEESSEREIKVGESKGVIGKTTEDVAPLNLYYSNSRSEYIYTSEQLNAGASNITAMAYNFYSSATTDPKITKTRIWMQNTSEKEVASEYELLENMTLVYEYDGNPDWKKGGSASELLTMSFNLDNAFEYSGENLRVVIESNGDNYAQTYFSYDDSDTKLILTANDKYDTFVAQVPKAINKMPVTYFTIQNDPVIITGKVIVKDDDDNTESLGSALIKAVAKDSDTQYSTITDIDGTYSLPVLQPNKEYTISASHATYGDSEPQDMDFVNKTHDFVFKDTSTGLHDIDSSEIVTDDIFYNLNGLRVTNVVPGIYVRIKNGKSEKIIIR